MEPESSTTSKEARNKWQKFCGACVAGLLLRLHLQKKLVYSLCTFSENVIFRTHFAIISEAEGKNNTTHHSKCIEDGKKTSWLRSLRVSKKY